MHEPFPKIQVIKRRFGSMIFVSSRCSLELVWFFLFKREILPCRVSFITERVDYDGEGDIQKIIELGNHLIVDICATLPAREIIPDIC